MCAAVRRMGVGRSQLLFLGGVLGHALCGGVAQAQVKAIGWGEARFDSSWSSEPFEDFEAGGRFTVARRANGTFALWGGGPGNSQAPSAPPVGVEYTSLSAGDDHCLALRSDGVAVGWPASAPATAHLPLNGVAKVASGAGFGLFLFTNGTLWSVGSNSYGLHIVPQLPTGVTYVDAATGTHHALALRSDGALIGWGRSDTRQTNVPALPPGRSFVEFDGGTYHSVARLDDGSVTAWGLNTWGLTNVPPLPPGVTYVKISAGSVHTVALRSDGQVVAWGYNLFGQCDVPALPPGMTYLDVSAGGPFATDNTSHSVARRSDGKLVSWGWNGYGQLGMPEIAPGVSVVELDVGCGGLDLGGPPVYPHTLARLSDGNVIAWGDTWLGQLAVPPLPGGVTYVEIDAGAGHSVARRSDGVLVSWGNNSWGQLNGTPLPLPGQPFIEVAAGAYHSLARRSDGSVVAWGYGSAAAPAPALPAGLTYVEIDASVFSLARRSDGSVVAWGNNTWGQLDVPALPAGVTYVEIAAGLYHGLALRSDGQVVAWGSNSMGQLNVPPLPAGVSYVEVAAGSLFSAARRSDGVIRVWGASPWIPQSAPALGQGERYSALAAGDGRLVALVEQPWTVYCTAKLNSRGCTPAITASGAPSASATTGFTIQCSAVRNQKSGLLFYAPNSARAAAPFQCGVLCMGPSLRRTPPQVSGGNALPFDDCTGVFSLDLNAFASGNAGGAPDPALRQPGTLVHAQWWGRDSGFPAPCNSMLSNALEFTLAP